LYYEGKLIFHSISYWRLWMNPTPENEKANIFPQRTTWNSDLKCLEYRSHFSRIKIALYHIYKEWVVNCKMYWKSISQNSMHIEFWIFKDKTIFLWGYFSRKFKIIHEKLSKISLFSSFFIFILHQYKCGLSIPKKEKQDNVIIKSQ